MSSKYFMVIIQNKCVSFPGCLSRGCLLFTNQRVSCFIFNLHPSIKNWWDCLTIFTMWFTNIWCCSSIERWFSIGIHQASFYGYEHSQTNQLITQIFENDFIIKKYTELKFSSFYVSSHQWTSYLATVTPVKCICFRWVYIVIKPAVTHWVS